MNRRALVSVVVVVALGMSACGDDEGGDEGAAVGAGTERTGAPSMTEGTEAPATAEGTEDGEPESASTGPATVAVSETSLGPVLVDAEGMTLYLFTPDSPDASTCTGQCAEVWPPLTVEGDPVAGDDVDQALLGTIERDDGTTQVTYAGHPLYTYAPDEEPGDTDGQGVNGVWWVVSPQGEAVEEAASAAPSVGY